MAVCSEQLGAILCHFQPLNWYGDLNVCIAVTSYFTILIIKTYLAWFQVILDDEWVLLYLIFDVFFSFQMIYPGHIKLTEKEVSFN